MTRVDGNGTGPRDPSGGRRADAGTTVRTVRGRQRDQVSVCGARRHERAIGGAALGGTIGYVGGAALGGTIGWVTGREEMGTQEGEKPKAGVLSRGCVERKGTPLHAPSTICLDRAHTHSVE